MGGRLSSGTFVGRAAELRRLDDALTAISETGASTVLIGGDAGIGKSRLIDEFCRRARARGALVATGLCTPAEGGGLPYGPVIGAVRDASRQLSSADSERIFGAVRQLLAIDGVLAHERASGLIKTNLFEAVLKSVETLADSTPVVLAFDDLQWADSASVELIDFLTRNLIDRPVLLVASYRTDEIEQGRPLRRLVSELGRNARASELELVGLDRDEVAHLLAAILSAPPDWALVEAVLARSGGNPFFAEELTAARHATALPASLRNVVMMRIDRLSKAARHVVGVAAASGGAIHYRLLSASAGMGPEELDAVLAEAVDHQVLVASPSDDVFRFRHAILREAVYDSLLPGERGRVHKALALALSSDPQCVPGEPGRLAYELADHWWAAGQWAEAFAACYRAGEHAAALLVMPEAHGYFERALIAHERARQGEHPPVDVLMKAADAAYLNSESQRSVELIRHAIEILDGEGNPRQLATCYAMLARNAWAAGESTAAADALHRGAAVLPAEPTRELAGILAEEARILMLTSHYEAAEAKCDEAIAVARATDARVEESNALITVGCCVAERGDVDAGAAAIREGMAIAADVGNADQLNRAYNNLGYVLALGGRLTEAVALAFGESTDIADINGVRLSAAGQNCAEALVRLGRYAEADQLMQRMSDRGVGSCVFGPNGVRANIAIRTGRFEDAERSLAEAEAMSAGVSTVQVSGALRMMHAELALERDDPAAAMAEIERALSVAAGTDDADFTAEMCALGLRAVADSFEQARVRGRRLDSEKVRLQAIGLVQEAEALVERRNRRGHPCTLRLKALVAQCHAEASRVADPDPDRWSDAAASWNAAGEPYPEAYCRWREAEALLSARGERKRAIASVQHAWLTAVQLGAPTLQTRVERLATRARITLDLRPTESQSTVADDLGLTAREVEVLAQLAVGRTDRQIAEELFISRKTASVHVSNLLRKLDVGSRVEAAEIGQRAGLSP